MNYSSIYTHKEYEENGESKKRWYRVGYIKETSAGGRFMTLFQQPDTSFFIFNDDEKIE